MKNIWFIVTSTFLFACGNSTFDAPYHSKKMIEIKSLSIDSFQIDASNTSGLGTFYMDDSTINFFDVFYNSLYKYSLNGSEIGRYFGKGEGPTEFSTQIFKVQPGYKKGEMLAIGAMTLFKANNKNWNKKFLGIINFERDKASKLSVDPDNPAHYNTNFANAQSYHWHFVDSIHCISQIMPDNNLSSVDQQHNADEYYQNGKNLGIFNIQTMKMEKVIIKHPDIYKKHKYYASLNELAYQLVKDTLYVSFAADSLIYVYKYPDKALFSMGYAGIDMNTSYKEVKNEKDLLREHKKDYLTKGFYYDLKYIKETNLMLRVYAKGEPSDKFGLQVYRQNNLIADVEVPEFFLVLGYKSPYYYAVKSKPDEETSKFIFYKFKI